MHKVFAPIIALICIVGCGSELDATTDQGVLEQAINANLPCSYSYRRASNWWESDADARAREFRLSLPKGTSDTLITDWFQAGNMRDSDGPCNSFHPCWGSHVRTFRNDSSERDIIATYNTGGGTVKVRVNAGQTTSTDGDLAKVECKSRTCGACQAMCEVVGGPNVQSCIDDCDATCFH